MWDLRKFQSKTPLATFKHHTEPVTTVEWHPSDSAVFASGGADNQIALWDLSVEKDTETQEEDVEVIFNYLYYSVMSILIFVIGCAAATSFHSSRTKGH